MRTFDFSPLMQAAIGFDDLFRMAEDFERGAEFGDRSYPPFNIERWGDDNYRISMALAGFSEDDIDVTLEDDTLTITGGIEDKEETEAEDHAWVHRGIARRSFTRKFQLADSIKVTGASFDNGMLHVTLEREVPEHKKPRTIPIEKGASKPAIEGRKTKTRKAA